MIVLPKYGKILLFTLKKNQPFFFIIALLNVYIYLCTDIGFKKNTHEKFTSANILKVSQNRQFPRNFYIRNLVVGYMTLISTSTNVAMNTLFKSVAPLGMEPPIIVDIIIEQHNLVLPRMFNLHKCDISSSLKMQRQIRQFRKFNNRQIICSV